MFGKTFLRGLQTRPSTDRSLLELTEKILETETAGWTQRMSDVLAELRDPRPGRGGGNSGGRLPSAPPRPQKRAAALIVPDAKRKKDA